MRTADLVSAAVSDLFAERRLLTGMLPSTSVMGIRHVIVSESEAQPEPVYCILGFDDIAASSDGFSYTGQRTDGTCIWISKLYFFSGCRIADDATADKYRLGIENGLLYIEEVV